MMILHGAWLSGSTDPYEGRLVLWAEDSQAYLEVMRLSETSRKDFTSVSIRGVRLHPYPANTERIRSALSFLVDDSDHAGHTASSSSLPLDEGSMASSSPDESTTCGSLAFLSCKALLPVSASGLVLPSYQLERTLEEWIHADSDVRSILGQRSSAGAHGNANLLSLRVPTLVVSPSDVAPLLMPIMRGQRKLRDDLLVADDLVFFAELMKFVVSLVARGRMIPVVEPCAGSGGAKLRSHWRVFVNEEDDLERYRLLVRSVPPVCRAFSVADSDHEVPHADALSRSEVVREFLAVASDALVRTWLSQFDTEIPGTGVAGLWLSSLAGEDSFVSVGESNGAGDPSDLEQISAQTMGWVEALADVTSSARFRTCFRLEPPESADHSWTLRYFIVDEKDRSLLVPASRVWQEGEGILRFLSRRYERPLETFKGDLQRAGEAFRPIRTSMRQSMAPDHCELSPQEAYDFLKNAGPSLEKQGFVVLLPAIEKLKHKPRVKMRIRSADIDGGDVLSFGSLLEYDWRVALGDAVIDAEDFQRLVDLKAPMINIRGMWVELDEDHLNEVAELLEDLGDGDTVTASRAIYLSLAGGKEGHESEIEEVEIDDRLSSLLEQIQTPASYEQLEAPTGFRGQLRPYQARGFSWLRFLTKYGFGACLADDMGLGKTIQLLALALHYCQTTPERDRRPILIVCPASVVYNWQRETERFAPSLRVMVHHGADRAAGNAFVEGALRHDLVITTYALASRDARVLAEVRWSGVVLDEAQNIKNPRTKQAKSIKKLKSDYRVALTGTPVENRLAELWSIMDFLNPGYLGSLQSFRSHYATPIERKDDNKRAELLRKVVRPFVLRRLKTDPAVIRDLPEKEEIKTYCNLTPEQATLYEAFVQNTLDRIDKASGMERRGLIFAMLTGLKQICNHPAHFLKDQSALEGRSGKLLRLSEMLEEVISECDSALVFTQFVEMGELLKKSLKKQLDCEVLFLHGGVPALKRAEMVERFQSQNGSPIVFILSLRAGGTGLNLTSASRVFHYDRWWNPAVENQATDRAFRIGQSRNVQVYKFICRGTLEERIDALIDEKKALAETVIGSGEEWVTELSTDELRQLIALDAEAVVNE